MPVPVYPINTGAIAEIAMEYTLNGQQNISLFHYVYSDSPVITDGYGFMVDTLAALAFADNLYDRYRAALSFDVGVVNMYGQWITPLRYAYVTYPAADDASGPTGALPQNVAVAITKRGIVAAPGYIGTLHMGAVPAAWVINGRVVQPLEEPYVALANQIATTLSVADTDDMVPVLFNRTNPADSAIIAEAFFQDTSRIMRRRTVGLGS